MYADRIFIVNSFGYNSAEPQLINAISNNGHTVFQGTIVPIDLTSTCINPSDGFDWLCFFGTDDYSIYTTQIQSFIDVGGKVFYQYEVGCCVTSSSSVASILSNLTGLSISANNNDYIAGSGSPTGGGWTATNLSCCGSFIGNAYKGMDGIPSANQLLATSNINGSLPPILDCINFGFFFTTIDFLGSANKGGIIGLGDMNVWYDGSEPFSNGGTTAVNPTVIDYFFPNSSSTCFLFPSGCLESYNNTPADINLGADTTLCYGEILLLDASVSTSTYLWQDNSTNSTFNVVEPGEYWVDVTSSCGNGSDTIIVDYLPEITVELGNDTTLCHGALLTLDASGFAGSYLWQDGSSNSFFNIAEQGNYWLEVTTNCGNVSDTIKVYYEECEIILEMPNIFTPNKDGENDDFTPIRYSGIKQSKLKIYNRWGQCLAETTSLVDGWNGKSDGKECTEGTYFWTIEYVTISDKKEVLQGFLTLVK